MSDKTLSNESFCQEHPLLLAHLEAVLQYNQKKNLTSITELHDGKVFHIEDSLAVLPEIQAAPQGQMADLGSGAGFPGIPLALASKRQTTLIESNKKKAQFLQGFIDDNKLARQISVAAMRSEELAQEQAGAFAVVTARAVAELAVLLELAAPLLEKKGRFVALKGQPDADELRRGDAAAGKLGMCLLQTRAYSLSGSKGEVKRLVLVYEKSGQPSLSLPRRPGMATKRPLC